MPVFISGNSQPVGIFPNLVKCTTSGSWTVPAGVTLARAKLKGGGAFVPGANSYACDGAEREEVIAVTPGASMPYVIGAGAASSGNGGSTIFAGMTAGGGVVVQALMQTSGSPVVLTNILAETRNRQTGVGAAVYGVSNVGAAGAAGVLEIWY